MQKMMEKVPPMLNDSAKPLPTGVQQTSAEDQDPQRTNNVNKNVNLNQSHHNQHNQNNKNNNNNSNNNVNYDLEAVRNNRSSQSSVATDDDTTHIYDYDAVDLELAEEQIGQLNHDHELKQEQEHPSKTEPKSKLAESKLEPLSALSDVASCSSIVALTCNQNINTNPAARTRGAIQGNQKCDASQSHDDNNNNETYTNNPVSTKIQTKYDALIPGLFDSSSVELDDNSNSSNYNDYVPNFHLNTILKLHEEDDHEVGKACVRRTQMNRNIIASNTSHTSNSNTLERTTTHRSKPTQEYRNVVNDCSVADNNYTTAAHDDDNDNDEEECEIIFDQVQSPTTNETSTKVNGRNKSDTMNVRSNLVNNTTKTYSYQKANQQTQPHELPSEQQIRIYNNNHNNNTTSINNFNTKIYKNNNNTVGQEKSPRRRIKNVFQVEPLLVTDATTITDNDDDYDDNDNVDDDDDDEIDEEYGGVGCHTTPNYTTDTMDYDVLHDSETVIAKNTNRNKNITCSTSRPNKPRSSSSSSTTTQWHNNNNNNNNSSSSTTTTSKKRLRMFPFLRIPRQKLKMKSTGNTNSIPATTIANISTIIPHNISNKNNNNCTTMDIDTNNIGDKNGFKWFHQFRRTMNTSSTTTTNNPSSFLSSQHHHHPHNRMQMDVPPIRKVLAVLFIVTEIIVLSTIGTSYYGTSLALRHYKLTTLTSNKLIESTASPPLLEITSNTATNNNVTINTSSINEDEAHFSSSSSTSTTNTTNTSEDGSTTDKEHPNISNGTTSSTRQCKSNEAYLQLRILFDSRPDEVEIILKDLDSGEYGSPIWYIDAGTVFQSFSQAHRRNVFGICLPRIPTYSIRISDTKCNGLISSGYGSTSSTSSSSSSASSKTVFGQWDIQYDGYNLVSYNGDCNETLSKSTTTSSSSSSSSLINACGGYSSCLYNVAVTGFVNGSCSSWDCTT